MQLGTAPFLATRIDGDRAWVSLIYVPRPMRRRGLGRQMFERWARTIPPEVSEIKVLAAEIDDEQPFGFWVKMGFQADDTPEDFIAFPSFLSRPVQRRAG